MNIWKIIYLTSMVIAFIDFTLAKKEVVKKYGKGYANVVGVFFLIPVLNTILATGLLYVCTLWIKDWIVYYTKKNKDNEQV